MKTKQTWRTRAAFNLSGRGWTWMTWNHTSGNRHEAILAKAKELGARGYDFGQADHEEASRANF